jgi:hypothetical protein
MNLTDTIRQAARKSGLSVYRLAKDAGLPVSIAQRFMKGGGLRCGTAERLAKALDYRIVLQPVERERKGG